MREVTGASDQYSLGVVAWEMLTGSTPFAGDSAVTTMYKHCHEPLPPLQDFRPDAPTEGVLGEGDTKGGTGPMLAATPTCPLFESPLESFDTTEPTPSTSQIMQRLQQFDAALQAAIERTP